MRKEIVCPYCKKNIVDKTLTRNQMKILSFVKKKEIDITSLSKKIGLSYKNTWFNVQTLEQLGFVTKKEETNTQGRKMMVIIK